jgi:hypothetical protein
VRPTQTAPNLSLKAHSGETRIQKSHTPALSEQRQLMGQRKQPHTVKCLLTWYNKLYNYEKKKSWSDNKKKTDGFRFSKPPVKLSLSIDLKPQTHVYGTPLLSLWTFYFCHI